MARSDHDGTVIRVALCDARLEKHPALVMSSWFECSRKAQFCMERLWDNGHRDAIKLLGKK